MPLFMAEVVGKEKLSAQVMRVHLSCTPPLSYKSGQFVNLRHQGLMRSYSLASTPEVNEMLELHVQRVHNGRMSGWIHDDMAIGNAVQIQGPFGDCVYTPGSPQQPLLLIGTGSGLAPLWGVLNDALHHGHTAAIHLFHGSRTLEGLYLIDELRTLAKRHANFSYTPCLSGEDTPPPDRPSATIGSYEPGVATVIVAGRVNAVALAAYPRLKDWRIYLCGNADMVKATKKQIFLAGAALKNILADPFEFSQATPHSAASLPD